MFSGVYFQGRRELGGGPGQIFLGAPISKFFLDKIFFKIFSTLPQFFIPNFGISPKKTKYIALFAQEAEQKVCWGLTKKF
jgi:hypothetical protein